MTELFGAACQVMDNCPEWEYDPHSKAKPAFGDLGKKVSDKPDRISVDPDTRNLHAPSECLGFLPYPT